MNTYYLGTIPVTDEIYHHGILGQKWGIRRYQNTDGTLTAEGKKRYSSVARPKLPTVDENSPRSVQKALNAMDRRRVRNQARAEEYDDHIKRIKSRQKNKNIDPESKVGLRNQDKLGVLEKKFVEKKLENIAYMAATDALIKNALSKGYSVSSIEIQRDVTSGKMFAAELLANMAMIPVTALTGVSVISVTSQYAPGLQYVVRDNKNGR